MLLRLADNTLPVQVAAGLRVVVATCLAGVRPCEVVLAAEPALWGLPAAPCFVSELLTSPAEGFWRRRPVRNDSDSLIRHG